MVRMTLQREGSAADRQPTVLIVDDEPQIIEFLRVGFGYEGFTVSVATTGPEALRCITGQQPDIVILDIMLPGLARMAPPHPIPKPPHHPTIFPTPTEN